MLLSYVEFVGTVKPNDPFRSVGADVPKLGWKQFFDGRADDDIKWGAGGIWLHMPFGHDGSALYQFDSWKRCRDQRLVAITDDFLSSAQRWRVRHPISRLGIYLGAVQTIPVQPDPAAWLHYAAECVEVLRPLGADLYIDASAEQPAGSDAFALASLIRNRNVKVSCEPRPKVGFEHWCDFGVVCEWWLWQDAETGKWDTLPIARDRLRNVTILMTAKQDRGQDYNNIQWAIDGTKAAGRAGYDVALPVDVFRQKGIQAAQLTA